jgi:hypothetical protein
VSWVDPVLAVIIGLFAAFGASRRLIGFFVGVGGVVLAPALLGLADDGPWIGIGAGLMGGLVLALVGRGLFANLRRGAVWQKALGALGGTALGVVLVLTLVTSLPIQRSPFDPNQIFYPPRDLPAALRGGVTRSWTVALGRDVLLYPLLDAEGLVPEERRPLLDALHRWLVVGEPWRGEGGTGS